jgi:ribulose-phosphate 3-epimerase
VSPSVEGLSDVLNDLDLVCLMSVNPGFGGQKFIPKTFDKTRKLRNMMNEAGSNAHIEIDGGVGLNNWKSLVDAGADVLVAGSSTFKAADPHAAIREMKGLG